MVMACGHRVTVLSIDEKALSVATRNMMHAKSSYASDSSGLEEWLGDIEGRTGQSICRTARRLRPVHPAFRIDLILEIFMAYPRTPVVTRSAISVW